jgi:hypothetical protein
MQSSVGRGRTKLSDRRHSDIHIGHIRNPLNLHGLLFENWVVFMALTAAHYWMHVRPARLLARPQANVELSGGAKRNPRQPLISDLRER